MKTITFYSYKGGVGRSLCLANVATRLSEFGKKVCLLDFDLEAPGLHYKFNRLNNSKVTKGIVDYIHEFSSKGKIPDSIAEYSYNVPLRAARLSGAVNLIPAGNIHHHSYWSKLSSINWNELFYNENSLGISFFLDLKQKIKRDINPDFLLIDSRTGITEIGGVSLSLLPDEIVMIGSNNDENIEGARNIIANIYQNENLINEHRPRINFVLSRIPFPSKPEERANESLLKDSVLKKINGFLNKKNIDFQLNNILTIHSDRELELRETLKINQDDETSLMPISKDYITLFEEITKDVLSVSEIERFNNSNLSQKMVAKARLSDKESEQISLFTNAISLDKNNFDAYSGRGVVYHNLERLEEARKDYQKASKLIPNHFFPFYALGVSYLADKNHEMAMKNLNKAIEINPRHGDSYHRRAHLHFVSNNNKLAKADYDSAIKYMPNSHITYNARANWYRLNGNYKEALSDVYKAIELNPKAGVPYGTLAEIKAEQNKLEDFYVNLELALMFDTEQMEKSIKIDEEIYKKFFDSPRFVKILAKYNIEL